MLTRGGYPLFPTSTQGDRKRCLDCGQWYDARLDHCPYCMRYERNRKTSLLDAYSEDKSDK